MFELVILLFVISVLFLFSWVRWIKGGPNALVKSVLLLMVVTMSVGIGTFYLSKSRSFQFFGHLVSEVKTNKKVVALTFDDGPYEGTTAEVLSILERQGILATFFLNGANVEKYPEETLAIIEAGHELGNHSYSHPRMLFISYDVIADEMEATDEAMRQIGYEPTGYVRSPYCKKFVTFPWYLRKTGQINITWSIEPESYYEDADRIYIDVMDHIEPGAIILLHPLTKNRSETRKVLEKIIIKLKIEGYEFLTVSELVKMKE